MLERGLLILPWISTIDLFQHWLYTHPNHTRDERTAHWLSLVNRFGRDLDWTGYEPAREASWQAQLHLFSHPFYYVEYGIARRAGLHWVQVHEIETGAKTGSVQSLKRIAEALGVPLDDLV